MKKMVKKYMKIYTKICILGLICLLLLACQPALKKDINQARQWLSEQKYEEVVKLLSKTAKDHAKQPDVFNMRGVAYLELGKFKEAQADFEKAITLNEKDYRYFFNLGNLHQKQKNYTLAVENYEKALKLDNSVYEIHHNSGVVLLALQRNAEALAVLNRAIDLQASDANLYLTRSEAAAKMNQNEQAKHDLEKAILLEPTLGTAHLRLAVLQLSLSKGKASEDVCLHLQKAKENGFEAQAQALLNEHCK
ncbi:tetratricopeptide repeat protein [Hugenholtzia roseola]|uniref:tetratricopeptide repeat protein n=1 Tax=Hugenholtzia roseola TaxID=1002 RepID=UPI000A323A64|nr:tetratricopeptide repeat protein [Hugenholtzia roseola]